MNARESQLTTFQLGWDCKPDPSDTNIMIPHTQRYLGDKPTGRSFFDQGDGSHGQSQSGFFSLVERVLLVGPARAPLSPTSTEFSLDTDDRNDLQLLLVDAPIHRFDIFLSPGDLPGPGFREELWMIPLSKGDTSLFHGWGHWWSLKLPFLAEKPLRWWLERLSFKEPERWRIIL